MLKFDSKTWSEAETLLELMFWETPDIEDTEKRKDIVDFINSIIKKRPPQNHRLSYKLAKNIKDNLLDFMKESHLPFPVKAHPVKWLKWAIEANKIDRVSINREIFDGYSDWRNAQVIRGKIWYITTGDDTDKLVIGNDELPGISLDEFLFFRRFDREMLSDKYRVTFRNVKTVSNASNIRPIERQVGTRRVADFKQALTAIANNQKIWGLVLMPNKKGNKTWKWKSSREELIHHLRRHHAEFKEFPDSVLIKLVSEFVYVHKGKVR